jgi:hypothetical protein
MNSAHRVLLGALLVALHAVNALGTSVDAGSYHGWTNAWTLDNGIVRAVVVPEIGRVIQFGFSGEPGVFWENPRLLGKPMPAKPWETHGSFGGDKTWPAPQSAWNWPPPDVFDKTAVDGMPDGDGGVILASPVSPSLGIRTERRVTLDPLRPVMHIVTTYLKVQGEPVEVSIWVITQVRPPEKAFLPIPARSRFFGGLSKDMAWPSEFLRFGYRRVSITRDPANSWKIGNDADRLLWVGPDSCLRIDQPRDPGATYPDGGCSMEIYTNGDPVPYVELETLAPLRKMSAGDIVSATNTYTLFHRRRRTAEAEADALLK